MCKFVALSKEKPKTDSWVCVYNSYNGFTEITKISGSEDWESVWFDYWFYMPKVPHK